MASFQAHTGWKRLKKRKNKNYRFVSFRTDVLEKIQEKQQKNSINKKKKPLWLHYKPKQVGKGRERGKIKIVFPFPSDRTRNRKFQKKRI